MHKSLIFTAGLLGALSASCGGSEYVGKLRAALDRADISLAQATTVAEEQSQGVAVKAKLHVDADAVFVVDTHLNAVGQALHIDIQSAKVLSADGVSAAEPCAGSIPLVQAIVIAEAAMNGEAVSVGKDDDDACLREVQVLVGDTLWEVKESRTGEVLETEEADEPESDEG